jgi:hypothetical protein
MQFGDLWAGLLGAMVGAVVGGAATLFASLIVERQRVARETRIRMYDELVPAILDGYLGYASTRIPAEATDETKEYVREYERLLRELERASVIAGRKDHALTLELINVLIASELGAHAATTNGVPESEVFAAQLFEDQVAFNSKARRLQAYLAGKIR